MVSDKQNNSDSTLPTTLFATQSSWVTPKKSEDLKRQLRQFNDEKQVDPSQRLLFRKIQKSFDEKDFQLAMAQQKIQALESQLEVIRPRKRKKVETSPNSKFANIEAIYRVRDECAEISDIDNGNEETEVSTDEESCIVVS